MEEPVEILEKLRDEGEDSISTSDLRDLQDWANYLQAATKAAEGELEHGCRYLVVTSVPRETTDDPIRDRRLARSAPRERPRAAKLELIVPGSNYSRRLSLGLVSSRAEVRELVKKHEAKVDRKSAGFP